MRTERLLMSLVVPEHAADFQRVMHDPEMGQHTDVPCQPTEKRAVAFVNWMQRLGTSGKGKAWALCEGEDVIGFMRLNRIDKRSSVAVVGYEIAKAHWGQGLASEALARLVRYSHGELKIHRLEAWVFNGNYASAKVLEKAGFQQEGVQRSKAVHRNERRDLWLFGRLASDPI